MKTLSLVLGRIIQKILRSTTRIDVEGSPALTLKSSRPNIITICSCSLSPRVGVKTVSVPGATPGPKGEGGLDDATGQSGTKQQSMLINQGLVESDERATFDLDSMLKKMSLKSKADKAEEGAEDTKSEEGFSFKTLFGIKK